VVDIFSLKAILERGRMFFILSLFFILHTKLSQAEGPASNLLLDNRISSDLFIPTLGKTFDPQAFISRSGSVDLSSLDCSVSNTHNKIDSVSLVDGESYLCGYRYERSITKKLRLQGSLNSAATGGGIFDSSISGWHRFWGFPNGNRTGSANNQYNVQGTTEDGEHFNLKEENFGILDPQIYASYLLSEAEKESALYFNAGLSVPLQLSQFASKTPNFLFGLTYNRHTSVSSLSLGTDLTLRTDTSDQGLNYSPVSAGIFAGWTRSIFDSLAFVSNTTLQSQVVENIADYPEGVWYVDLGIRTDIILGVPLEILIRENLYPSKGSADVSLILRVLKF